MKQRTQITMARLASSAALTLALIAAIVPAASAEACAWFQVESEAHAHANAALRHGILILLLPTLVLFFLIAGLVYRRRNASR